jgi:Tfp pilus assembly protein PilF
MLVSLPILLLLLDWWPLRRTASPTRLVIEKVPLALLSAASCVVTYLAQQAGGAVAVEEFPFTVRAANAAVSAVAYLWKTIVPIRLAAFYPHPGATVPPWHVIGSVAVLVGMTACVLIQARKRTYLAVGWLWYLVTLVPVIGLLQVGVQGMADRYTYIPLIGIFTAATWGVSEACRRTLVEEPPAKHKKSRRSRPAAPTLCKQIMRFVPVLVIAGCAVGTWHQTGYWKDETSLCAHAIAVTRRNAVMYNNLGVALYEQGDTEASIVQYIKALEIAPDYADVHINLGNAYVDEGTPEAAIEEYYKAIRCNPRDPRAYNNLATVLGQMNMLDEAIRACRKAIELDPSIAEPHSNLGHALAILGRMDDAVEEYRIAIELDRDNARTHLRLAEALYAVRDYAGAWQEIEAGRKCGMEPDPEFLKELSTAMPEPDK